MKQQGKESSKLLFPKDQKLSEIAAEMALKKHKPTKNAYGSLIEAIGSQQLSVKAADTIINRFKDHYGGDYPKPELLLATEHDQLRAFGFSNAKAKYLKHLAEFALTGGLEQQVLNKLSDDEAVEYLTQLHGIGRWTAEVVLLFDLGRPDVFPVDDLGIQDAMKRLYKLRSTGKALHQRMHDIAEKWRPQRSLASRYLWHWRGIQIGR